MIDIGSRINRPKCHVKGKSYCSSKHLRFYELTSFSQYFIALCQLITPPDMKSKTESKIHNQYNKKEGDHISDFHLRLHRPVLNEKKRQQALSAIFLNQKLIVSAQDHTHATNRHMRANQGMARGQMHIPSDSALRSVSNQCTSAHDTLWGR